MKIQETQVLVNTKSDFMGLNGKWLSLYEFQGRRVTVKYRHPETEVIHTIDFTIDEVVEFQTVTLQG